VTGIAQSPKSGGVSPACRMMERVVPMGSSFFGCGTMAMRPETFLYLAWLPRYATTPWPCMTKGSDTNELKLAARSQL
jgi:hypothetical protein